MLQIDVLLALVHLKTGVLEAVQEGNGVGAVHVAGPGAAGDEVIGGAAEYGHFLYVLQRQHTVVFQKDHAFQGALAGNSSVGLEVRLVGVGIALHLGAALDKLQAAGDAYVQFCLREGTVLDGIHDLLVLQGSAGLQHVVAGSHLGGAVVTAEPVGHHEALEAPFVTKDGGDEVPALGSVSTVNLIVGAHDGPGIGLLHGNLDTFEVNLALGTGADDGVVARTVGFLVVVGEVLDGGAYVVFLDTAHVGSGCLAGYHGVFGVVFEVAAVERVTVNVEGGCEVHIGSVLMDFLTHGGAHALYQFLVPGAGQKGADGEVRAVVGVVISRTRGVDAKAGGTIGQHDAGNAQAGDGVGGAGSTRNDILGSAYDGAVAVTSGHAHADDHVHFFFQCHGFENLLHGRCGQLGFSALAAGKRHHCSGKEDEFFHDIRVIRFCVVDAKIAEKGIQKSDLYINDNF